MCRLAFLQMLRLPPMPEVTGNKAEKADVYREVARIHAASIKQGFLPTLGVRFLVPLYEAIDSDPNSALFIEQVNGKVVGFITGGRGMGSIYRQLFKRWPRLLVTLLPTLLNLAKLKRVVEIVWYGCQQKPIPGCPKAELFSISVLESARGVVPLSACTKSWPPDFFRKAKSPSGSRRARVWHPRTAFTSGWGLCRWRKSSSTRGNLLRFTDTIYRYHFRRLIWTY